MFAPPLFVSQVTQEAEGLTNDVGRMLVVMIRKLKNESS
jgi:hypothetical protein